MEKPPSLLAKLRPSLPEEAKYDGKEQASPLADAMANEHRSEVAGNGPGHDRPSHFLSSESSRQPVGWTPSRSSFPRCLLIAAWHSF